MISAESSILLEVEKREEGKIRAREALRKGLILGILYGKNIKKNIPLIFPKLQFVKVLNETGEGTLIKIRVGKEKNPQDAIIQDIQHHNYSGEVIHVDFMAVSLEEEVEVEVPLEFIGVSPAVKDLGGIFVQNVENIEIKCKAKDIPKSIPVDISVLATFDDMIHLKDISLPPSVELLDNPDNVIAMVDEPRSEQEMEELEQEAAPDVSEVEGVKKEGEEAVEEGTSEENKEEEPEKEATETKEEGVKE
ncbi:MAG: 50S ribosomal protein L25 [Candidatus Moranbacteria bacterium]|nr:50S ribosomal protein L25 [Candidatus Moranbacteria bacterium]